MASSSSSVHRRRLLPLVLLPASLVLFSQRSHQQRQESAGQRGQEAFAVGRRAKACQAASCRGGRRVGTQLRRRCEGEGAAAPAVHDGFLDFPPGFSFGVATAAYQIEGAAAEGGRAPSIWDDFSRKTHTTEHGATGDVACDHYHRYATDVEAMSRIGVQAYRFSISWSRILPDCDDVVNEEGVQFYSDLIDALLAKGITPWVTLYHWDLPSACEAKFGGWLGPKEDVTTAFGAYARTCFQRFGDRVTNWITLNEPWCAAQLGFGSGDHAPGRSDQGDTEPYLAAHNMLLAHAEAVRIYREDFAFEQGGRIGLSFNTDWRQPRDGNSAADVRAARQAIDFALGWFADPVYFGDYPSCMREACGDRLPRFSEEESRRLKGSSDFFGINSYSSNYAAPAQKDLGGGGWWQDIGVEWWHTDKDWERTDMDWPIVPWGFRELLLDIQRRYQPRDGIYVTENGCAHESDLSTDLDARAGAIEPKVWQGGDGTEDFASETFEDPKRVRFFKAHLSAVHAANAGGADVRGYFAWSLLDNFEWAYGYTKRFGIVHVDYPTQRRTIKSSGRFLAQTIQDRGFMAPRRDEQYAGVPF
eukprot:TRINITY_DN29996_c0_g1_i1.p1 TRINITY_DN29996_c0_g1~~TRINITY_DN29996_c0_g1_i1.p1  ORF type:complete len:587 (-),score=104.70 TRINITY_DN29996_c0_g1_i1:569-2329(-)